MAQSSSADLTTDYLVVGAGISGLCFVDELLDRTSATFLIVDKKALPGGHWIDTYPYVKLHQPSSGYGVESKELSNGLKDEVGLNKGLLDLASGSEIQSYCYTLMRDRFLPSGRVTFLPCTEYLPDGTLHQGPSGKKLSVQIHKKLVDASYNTNVIPLTHKRSFTSEGVTCIPPNQLPLRANDFTNFTVLGSGKTGTDTCLWLLEQGVDPWHIRWIVPADYWYFNRAMVQFTDESFSSSVNAFIAIFETLSDASSARDVSVGLEKAGLWLRLDRGVEPEHFHAATLAPRELDELRRISNIVRKGYVVKIEPDQIMLTKGTIETHPNTLYIDCTACCLPDKPVVPVFQPHKIVLQLIRYPLVSFSCSKIAFLESLPITEEEKNSLAKPMRYAKNIDGFIAWLKTDWDNRVQDAQYPALQSWEAQSRTSLTGPLIAKVTPEEHEKVALVQRMQTSFVAAYSHMPELIASLQNEPIY